MPVIITTPFKSPKIIDRLGAAGDLFGADVALSADGKTLAVGAYGNSAGKVLVYILINRIYTLQATLTPSTGQTGQYFGQHIDISSDGNYIIVGAERYTSVSNKEGRGYVFNRVGTTWTQQQILQAGDAAISDGLGACAINGAGNIIVMGARFNDAGASNAGAVYVFTRSGSSWTQINKLVDPSPAGNGYFGNTVDISRDGSTIIVGAYAVSSGAPGEAHVFIAPSWAHEATLVANDAAADDAFGRGVGLSANGDLVFVGAYLNDVGANVNQGSAYAFTRSVGVWTQAQQITSIGGAAEDRFGTRLSINDAGDKLLISSNNRDVNLVVDTGAAYVFELITGTWTQTKELVAPDPVTNKRFSFGNDVSSDFSVLAIGAFTDTINGNASQGSVYIK